MLCISTLSLPPSRFILHPWPSNVSSVWGGSRAGEVISRGGSTQVAEGGSEPLLKDRASPKSPHFLEWETEGRKIQRISQGDRLQVALLRSETKAADSKPLASQSHREKQAGGPHWPPSGALIGRKPPSLRAGQPSPHLGSVWPLTLVFPDQGKHGWLWTGSLGKPSGRAGVVMESP